MRRSAFFAAAFLTGCVTLPPEHMPIAHNPYESSVRDIPPPGPGATAQAGPRFLVRGYGAENTRSILAMVEEDYERVMADTGLFAFRPGGLYPVAVYKDEKEYLHKTGAPAWSGGIAFGNAIYTYEGPELETTLAHEISHVVFQEYMGGPSRLKWFNEGLAVYEEMKVAAPARAREIRDWMADSRRGAMPLRELVNYRPGDSRTHRWYGQSASVVRYLVEVGGRTGVARFLEETKRGTPLDAALAPAFPLLCTNLPTLESRWQNSND